MSEPNPEGRPAASCPASSIAADDTIDLLSVGIDIGSATSQVVFSRLHLEKVGNRYVTVGRRIAYQSEVALTPYLRDTTIDGERLAGVVGDAYRAAGFARSAIDTGAVIVTGVALDRDNARVIGELFAAEAGKFVTVSAGDHLEAVMAAFGSGAVDISRERDCSVLNIDVGGGTTKLALCRGGVVEGVAAVDAGARVVVLNDEDVVVGIEPAGHAAISRTGVEVRVGEQMNAATVDILATDLASCIFAAAPLVGGNGGPALRTLPLRASGPLDAVTFSGGVAEYVYGRETRRFGDLGAAMGRALRDRARELKILLLPLRAGIRATVLGVSQYAVQVSGSTICVSADELLPLRNVPVAGSPLAFDGDADEHAVAHGISARLTTLDAGNAAGAVALPVAWCGPVTYERLDCLARGVVGGFEPLLRAGRPVVLVFDEDVGQLFGEHLALEMRVSHPFVCIDCVELREFDFIDVGEPVAGATAVPVVIKSLVFTSP